MDTIEALRADMAACRHCARHLELGPRPVVQIGVEAKVLIIGQAPGRKVHESGVPWDDDSGKRLRDWTGIASASFYDPTRVALVPMGFCYPGEGVSGDLPPRPECAPLWHERVLAVLPADRLTLLVGTYAHAAYAGEGAAKSLTERVRQGATDPRMFFLPHPSWRVVGWMKRNPWFEAETLPRLRAAVRAQLAQ